MVEADGKFIRAVVDGKSAKEAYIEAYDEEKKETASAKANKLLKDPEFKKSIMELLARDGITIKKLNNRLKDKLEAKRPIVVNEKSTIEYVDDNAVQLEAIKTGYKLYGKLNENPNIQVNNAIFDEGLIERLRNTVPMRDAIDTHGEISEGERDKQSVG